MTLVDADYSARRKRRGGETPRVSSRGTERESVSKHEDFPLARGCSKRD